VAKNVILALSEGNTRPARRQHLTQIPNRTFLNQRRVKIQNRHQKIDVTNRNSPFSPFEKLMFVQSSSFFL
jgi:hypothetical protein